MIDGTLNETFNTIFVGMSAETRNRMFDGMSDAEQFVKSAKNSASAAMPGVL